jgi:prevent-host-death family protein
MATGGSVAQVSVHEARNRLSQLIKDAQAGEDVVIASHGKPVARLVPVRTNTGSDILHWLDANPLPADQRRTAEEIDAYLAEERASWD